MNHAMGYHSMYRAMDTITGIETMHMLRKGQVPFINGKSENKNLVRFFCGLFDILVPDFDTNSNHKLAA